MKSRSKSKSAKSSAAVALVPDSQLDLHQPSHQDSPQTPEVHQESLSSPHASSSPSVDLPDTSIPPEGAGVHLVSLEPMAPSEPLTSSHPSGFETLDSSVPRSLGAQPGKYLTFNLGSESYGIEILKVQEIIEVQPVTRVPQMPASVRGIINLRGKLIPIVDMHIKFGLPPVEDGDKTCIIVVQTKYRGDILTTGMVVDHVAEVQNIQAQELEAAPALGGTSDHGLLMGIAKMKESMILLLDIDHILSHEDGHQIFIAAA